MSTFPYDARVHTSTAGGRDGLVETARAAAAVGLEVLVVAASCDLEGEDLRDRVRAIAATDCGPGLSVAPAVLTDITDTTGVLDLHYDAVGIAPITYATLSGRTQGIAVDPPAKKDRYINNLIHAILGAVANPAVTALARPFNIGQFPAPLSPAQLPRSALTEIAQAMAQHDVAFEVCSRMQWWFPELSVAAFTAEYAELIAHFAACHVKFVVSSGSHCADGAGHLAYAETLLDKAGVGRSQVVDVPSLLKRTSAS
jgi:hypothetical protein